MSWKPVKTAMMLVALWTVANVSGWTHVLDYACAAETAPAPSMDFEPQGPPAGPHLQSDMQHSNQREEPSVDSLKGVGATVVGDVAYLVTVPLRMDLESGLITAGVAGVVGGVMVFDSNIQRWVQKHRTESGNEVFKQIGIAGDAVLPLNAGLALGGYVFRKSEAGNKLFQTSLVSLEAQALASSLTYLSKLAVGRNRPRQDPQGNSYDPFKEFGRSFPSGHATQLFAFAAVFADQYPLPLQVFLYTLATAVSAERIYRNHHFTSDVLAGAAIGYVVGKALVWRHTYGDKGLSFMPLDVAGGFGVSLQCRF